MATIAEIEADLMKLKTGASDATSKVKSFFVGDNGFLSRKLFVAIIALVLIIALGPTMGDMMVLITGIVKVYIIVQGSLDAVKMICNAYVNGKINDGLAAEGKLDNTTAAKPTA